ncbi:MAG: Nif3-like dinuclear metal center hexameric protein [Lachnospiraceae bacterium]|nr:Nif3-like dinuclear metal center hexameric protein [Lachnospiraceae bacterium]
MTCQEVIAKLEELSPVKYASDWDNVGLLAGRAEKTVNSLYIALDATDEVIDRCISQGADMILTHHPMIFSPLKSITGDDFVGRRVIRLIKNDICLYAMHTNFDVMGMADACADALGLKKRSVLEVTYEDEISKEGFGRVGRLPRIMTLKELVMHVKECFSVEHVTVYGDLDQDVEFAAICPGSGKSMADSAIDAGADVYITGDIGHHDGIDMVARGLSVIDAGHYGIEKIFVPYLSEYLARELPQLRTISHPAKEPSVIL